MGLKNLIRKIKTGFIRKAQAPLPFVSKTKLYGDFGEDQFVYELRHILPYGEIKSNVIIHSEYGDAEIDCLVLFGNKIFAVEIKRWKGRIYGNCDCFIQEKQDKWTDELYSKQLKSPFKQLDRAVYFLKKQIPSNVWINTLVYFENAHSVSIDNDKNWFTELDDVKNFILYGGIASSPGQAAAFFKKCIPADRIYSNEIICDLKCLIYDKSLEFRTERGLITRKDITFIQIQHHWSYDLVIIKLTDGTECYTTAENAFIEVFSKNRTARYALCKISSIVLGNSIVI